MKKTFVRAVLQPVAESQVPDLIKDKDFQQGLASLVLLIAQVLDDAAKGNNTYLSIGTTRDKGSMTIAVHQDGVPQSVFADNLEDLFAELKTLL